MKSSCCCVVCLLLTTFSVFSFNNSNKRRKKSNNFVIQAFVGVSKLKKLILPMKWTIFVFYFFVEFVRWSHLHGYFIWKTEIFTINCKSALMIRSFQFIFLNTLFNEYYTSKLPMKNSVFSLNYCFGDNVRYIHSLMF